MSDSEVTSTGSPPGLPATLKPLQDADAPAPNASDQAAPAKPPRLTLDQQMAELRQLITENSALKPRPQQEPAAAPTPPAVDEHLPPRTSDTHKVLSRPRAALSKLNPQRVGHRTRSFSASIPAALKKEPSVTPVTREVPLPPPARLKCSETEKRVTYLTGNSKQRADYPVKPAASTKHMSTVTQGVFRNYGEKARSDRRTIINQGRQRFSELLGTDTSSEVRVVLKVEEPHEKAARIIAALDFPIISKGAHRLFLTLHELATRLHAQEVEDKIQKARQSTTDPSAQGFRGRAMHDQLQGVPDSYLFHCPQEFIAELVKYNVRHVRRLIRELVEVGLIMASAISEPMPRNWQRKDLVGKPQTSGQQPGMYTGTLYRVRLQDDFSKPLKLTRADYQRRYRDLEQDTLVGRTPKLWMSELQTLLEGQLPTSQQLCHAVTAFITHNPLDVVRTSPLRSLQDTIYLLGGLQEIRGVEQAIQVDRLAHSLSQALNDVNWHRWWCKQLWHAIQSRTMESLKAQLERLNVDAREWSEVQNLGAVFAARQRVGTKG